MKRNHGSLSKTRIVIVSLFVLVFSASAFFGTSLSALADNPGTDACAGHLTAAAAATDPHIRDLHKTQYKACIHTADVKTFNNQQQTHQKNVLNFDKKQETHQKDVQAYDKKHKNK